MQDPDGKLSEEPFATENDDVDSEDEAPDNA